MSDRLPRISRLIVALSIAFVQCSTMDAKEALTFYEVPLACGAAPNIGCGSRIKPLFIDTMKEKSIGESWTNREGTVLAFIWYGDMTTKEGRDRVIRPLFERHGIEAKYISDAARQNELTTSLYNERDQWLEGMDVDKLSIEEAGVIATSLTRFAEDAKVITEAESRTIRKEIEDYFKTELVIVRSYEELRSAATQERWMRDGFAIYEKHIGKERAEAVSALYMKQHEQSEDWCCEESAATMSEITCPKCGHTKTEAMPTDYCLLKYTCEKCNTEMVAKKGDCCVFCSYGSHKCPSMEDEATKSN